ncbi:MAG: helix-turn-helix domain-containing protein [Nanoarchaeota archaeon]|nr:helix-turn-helix domain-containing protein [Nanoarchaeota archaeon]
MELRNWIKENQLSQLEVANRLKIHYSLLSRIVSGKRKPSLKLASLIEEATGGAVSRLELLYPTKEETHG